MNEPQEETKTVEPTPEQVAQEADAALHAGYKKARGEPPAEAAPAQKASTKAEEKPAGEVKADAGTKPDQGAEPKEEAAQAADPWEGVPIGLRTTLEKMSATVNHIGPALRRLKSAEDRIEAIGKASQQAATVAAKAGAETPTQTQVAAASATSEKWKKLKEDFPEWAEAMEERLAAFAPKAPAVDVEALKKEWAENTQAQVTSAINEAEERAYVRLKHPTWKQIVATPEFGAWMDKQAPEMQALADSQSADDAIRMLDAFTADQAAAGKAAAVEAKNKQRLAAAAPPKQAASGGPTILPDEAGLYEGYNRVKKHA